MAGYFIGKRSQRINCGISLWNSIKIKSGTITICIPIIFVEGAAVPRILGREGVFTQFCIFFDESRKRTALLDAHKEQKRIEALLA